MSTSIRNRLLFSTPNAIFIAVLVVGAVAAAIVGDWFYTVVLVAVGAGVSIAAIHARRPDSRDVARVNALEYHDERDRRIAQLGFASVGIAALILFAIEFVAVIVLAGPLDWAPAVQMLSAWHLVLLCVVWAVANSVAARRG